MMGGYLRGLGKYAFLFFLLAFAVAGLDGLTEKMRFVLGFCDDPDKMRSTKTYVQSSVKTDQQQEISKAECYVPAAEQGRDEVAPRRRLPAEGAPPLDAAMERREG
jgi:hypothetical protein